jgi:PAS domain S-box-containing protein
MSRFTETRNSPEKESAPEHDGAFTTPSSSLQGFLASIVESSDDAIVSKTLDGTVTSWNRAAERIFGYTAGEMIGHPIAKLAIPGQAEDMTRILEKLARGERVDHYETIRRTKDGRIIHVSLSVSPIRTATRKIIGAAKIVRDINERKLAEQALRESEVRFRTLFEQAAVGIEQVTLDGRIVGVNSKLCQMLGRDSSALLGKTCKEITHPDDWEREELLLDQLLAGERTSYAVEKRCLHGSGNSVWVRLTSSLARDPEGQCLYRISLLEGITDRKRAEEQNAALLEEIRQSVYHKDEFLGMLAHELRNPLAPLRNAVHLLHLGGEDPTVVARVRDMMDRQITHMRRLIDDLLDVSRITRGTITLNRERTDLARLVRLSTEDQRETFQNSGIELETRLPEIPVWVRGDRTRLTQVLENLLENARKFTPRGGKIEVEVVADPARQEALMQVRDTGIGIEPELLPRLFDLFTQADRSLDRSPGGLGLGLALVKRLVELHDGKVSAHSAGSNQGAEFTVRLPLEDEPMALSETRRGAVTSNRHVRVLVVEDNRDSAESLRMLLATQGYEVALAYTGTEGVEAARRARPDVVICDIGLPGMDGYAVARAIRLNPGTAQARLIAVTGYGQNDDRARALASGFDTHLVKPADPEKLLGLLA